MKPGYKQTEIGIIPKDWEVGSLKEAFLRLDAGVSVNSDEKATSRYSILKTSAVRNGIVNIHESKPVIPSEYSRLKCPVKKGSIIISRMNTPAMVGECGYVDSDAPNTFLPDRLWQVEPTSPEYDFKWLSYILITEKYGRAIRATATGTSNSMKNIAKERLLEIAIPKPSLPEQHRIAEALSDMDDLISSLEKLVAKKIATKQGAMQELLTGKRRLPGFSGNWNKSNIGTLCEIVSGGTPSTTISDYWNGNIPWCTPTDITLCKSKYIRETANKITDKGLRYSSANLLPPGAILLCSRATIGEARIAACPICTNQGFKSLIAHTDIDNEWLYYRVLSLKKDIMEKAIGSTFLEISKNALSRIPITVPKYEEQSAISQALSDIDIEIERLESRLNGTRQIKQGMMQRLLTGKIRV